MFRAIEDALESRCKRSIDGEYPVVPWLVTHAASECGECVMCAPAMSAGNDKFVVRWREGVLLGVRLESGESLIGTSDGVA